MKRFSTAFSAISIACGLFSAIGPSASGAEGFFTPATLPVARAPMRLEGVLAAVPRLLTTVSECSAAIVSPSGHVLTAMHCLEHERKLGFKNLTLVMPGTAQVIEGGKFVAGGALQKLDPAAPAQESPNACSGKEDFTRDGRPAEVDTYESLEDFALLKFEHPDFVDFPCLALSDHDPIRGQQVWAVGYPAAASRGAGPAADGESQRVTYGLVSDDPDDSVLWRGAQMTPRQYCEFKEIVLKELMTLADVDSNEGMSGGPLVSASGALAGVFMMGASTAETHFPSTGLAIRASFMRQRFTEILGAEKFAEAFSCRRQ